MSARRLPSSLAAALTLVLIAPAGHAGQRRVNVGVGPGGIQFGPASVTLNQNDHVTWVWSGGGHSVTNGLDPGAPGAGTIFDSGLLNGSTQSFSWKVDRIGNVPYYCVPHVLSGMTGTP